MEIWRREREGGGREIGGGRDEGREAAQPIIT